VHIHYFVKKKGRSQVQGPQGSVVDDAAVSNCMCGMMRFVDPDQTVRTFSASFERCNDQLLARAIGVNVIAQNNPDGMSSATLRRSGLRGPLGDHPWQYRDLRIVVCMCAGSRQQRVCLVVALLPLWSAEVGWDESHMRLFHSISGTSFFSSRKASCSC
jgi:hypothetical protein